MLTRIIRWSVEHPVVVLSGAAILLALGISTVFQARYDVFPEFVPPQASVQTEAPGLVPEQVEQLITRPLENALQGANGVSGVRSESIQGLSVITVSFAEGSDPFRARQVVAESLAEAASALPAGVAPPKLSPLTSSTMDLLKIGFLSDTLSPLELRDLVEWTVRPRLLAVPGVARATIFGGKVRRIEIRLRPVAMLARNVTMDEVGAAVRAAVTVRGGGFVDTGAQRVLIEARQDAYTPEQIATIGIAPQGGAPVRLGDIAEVRESGEPLFGDTLIMGKPGVLIALSSQYGANTLDTTLAVEAALDEISPAITGRGVSIYPALHRPANFIETAIGGIRIDLLLGAALVALVLLVFVRDLRIALISFVSIPLSLLAALIVLDRSGQSINTMTLGGLAVALGVVIDDAIIDVENISRRMRQAAAGTAAELREVVIAASSEVRKPILSATSILALTIAPVLLLHGIQGAFFTPLALSFLLSILASLAIAMTVTPALASLLLRRHAPHTEPRFLGWLKHQHRRMLGAILAHPRQALLSVILAGIASSAIFATFGAELLPAFRERHYVLQLSGPPGTSLAAMQRVGASLIDSLLHIEGIASAEQQTGRAEQGEDTWPPNRSELHVELAAVDGTAEERILVQIRELLDRYPGYQTEALTFLGDRIGESLSGETAAVAISIFGPDLDQLDRVAARLQSVVQAFPDATDVQIKAQPGAPLLRIALDPVRMAQYGVGTTIAYDSIAAAFGGATIAQITHGERMVNVAIGLDGAQAVQPESAAQLLIRGEAGRMLRLGDIATIDMSRGRTSVQHDGGRRRQVVTANPATADVAGFVSALKARIAGQLQLPAEVYLEFGGTAEGQSAASRELLFNSGIALISILIVLSLAFGGWRAAALVLAGAPFAAIGGSVAVLLGGGVITLGALVGFVTLFGITARNAILLIAHTEQLAFAEGFGWNRETSLRATTERVTPILMTAIIAGLALAPLALGSGEAGREVQGPMAQVIVGGLVSSTLLSLLILPALVLAWLHPHNDDRHGSAGAVLEGIADRG
ncbi:MAG: efflux RND transporter permease subunit [Gammaproteobacteria bacterium]|nr:efflux RND transporter permease subunit [Gammaproteobacteria bacterium]